jgi:hypothetical protein
MDFDGRVFFMSELKLDPELSPSERLAVAVDKLGGTEYIAGPSAKRYMETTPFSDRNIEVSFFEFKHPVYEQYHARYDHVFLPNMTSLDALFNLGYMPIAKPEEKAGAIKRSMLEQAHP